MLLMPTLLAPDGETLSMKPNPGSSGTQLKLDLRISGRDWFLACSA